MWFEVGKFVGNDKPLQRCSEVPRGHRAFEASVGGPLAKASRGGAVLPLFIIRDLGPSRYKYADQGKIAFPSPKKKM